METDKDNLNEYSCFVRKQLELHCVLQNEVDHIQETNPRKYNNGGGFLVAGQVGIRCNHCQQQTSSFPKNLSSVCAVSMAFVGNHFMKGATKWTTRVARSCLST
jgi:hypothetical protein